MPIDIENLAESVVVVTDSEVSVLETATHEINVVESAGTQGPPGAQGLKGDKGDKGDTGDQGLQGDKGDKGDKGDTGDQGLQGSQGLKGDKGDKGDTGDTGLKGDKGDTGDTGAQGLPGIPGSGSSSGIFILDVTPTSTGVVGNKIHPVTIPVNKVVSSCDSDTANIRVSIGVDGGAVSYSPTCLVNGVAAILTESASTRWFTGYADITIGPGSNNISASADTGALTYLTVNLAGAGPEVTDVTFGAYPGGQTALKAGDSISFTLTTELTATEVSLSATGASNVTRTFPVTSGTASGTLVVGSASGAQGMTFKARNSLGTYGNNYTSPMLQLDQVIPTFGTLSVAYPASKGALTTGDSATVTCTVSNYSSVSYSATGMTVTDPTVYASAKTAALSSTGYVDSGTNYTITANKASNGSSATKTGLVMIATTAPTAAITWSPTGRMVGSATGVDYTVTITATQNLNVAPSMNASAGTWLTSWSGSNKVWTRSLRIYDSTTKGAANFNTLSLTNKALIPGSTITSGSTYTVGGFTSRTLTFPAFSRVVAIGTYVLDQTKTTCQIVGGNTLTRYTDNTVRANGYYIANSDGSYNATGNYLGLSDSAFAGANTSGTLQATLVEVA